MRAFFSGHDTLAPREHKKRNKYFAFLFGQMLLLTELEIMAHVVALSTGTINTNQFGAQMLGTLQTAHPRAWVFGAQSQGSPVTIADGVEATAATVRDQADYLDGFIQDLTDEDPRYVTKFDDEIVFREDPRYVRKFDDEIAFREDPRYVTKFDDEIVFREDPIETRALLYNERIRGTANRGALDALPPWTEIDWVLGPNENHCEDCPELAKNGPYRPDTIPTLPGEGMTECLVNCKCKLRIDGREMIQF